jgi:catechol 2,3-dioxygenase-like lactoylglutathione lyase family enzyme
VKKNQAPQLFRLLLPAKDLGQSRRFYESLLGTRGRVVAPGRVYLDCGGVILGLLDYSQNAVSERPTEALYFSTGDLEGVHQRAGRLHALSAELIHNDPSNPAGEIVVRPWGERSFYAVDPSGNALCFVDSRTLFTGTPRQIAALGADRPRTPPRRRRSKAGRSSARGRSVPPRARVVSRRARRLPT